MSKPSRDVTCNACGHTGPRGKNGTYNLVHTCPKAGSDATDNGAHSPCPTHGTLIWVVGPYSTFRACGKRDCTAASGKPYRIFAARGGESTAESPTPSPSTSIPEVTPTPTTPPKATPVTTSAPKASPSESPAALNLKALGSLGDMIQTYVDDRATELATEIALKAISELGSTGPVTIDWTVNGKPFATVEGAHHKALPRLLKLYAAGFRNFLIVGPAGSGKTTLAHNLADSLGSAFAHVSCTAGMSESSLTGRAIPNLSSGETAYQSTLFVESYEAGGVFLLDEVDAADPNVMLVANSALANGTLALPNRESAPTATRHPDAVIICAANTWGTGADRQYVGRNQLDAAFLDRFVGATIEVEYDRDLESALIGDAHICARVWGIREKVAELKLRRVVGTRFLMSCARLVKGAGETLTAALTACTVGWSNDERSKVGVAS